MAERQSTEAPFPIVNLRVYGAKWALGWAASQPGVYVHSDERNPMCQRPLYVSVNYADAEEFGEVGQRATDDDRCRLAEHVYRQLWPEVKRIACMTKDECFEVVDDLDGSIRTPWFANVFVGVCYRPDYGADTTGGCALELDAVKGATRLLAMKQGRYDAATDTITPASDAK